MALPGFTAENALVASGDRYHGDARLFPALTGNPIEPQLVRLSWWVCVWAFGWHCGGGSFEL
jgi:hypothetical protein